MQQLSMQEMEQVHGGDACSLLFKITVASCTFQLYVACGVGATGHIALC